MSDEIKLDKIRKEAKRLITEEQFKQDVEAEKYRLRWPWYKRLCPFRVEIKIVDLRKE